jgi:hypothetical protein
MRGLISILLIIIIAFILLSCSHYKWLDKNKDKICNEYCNTIISIDSIYIDSTITITKLDSSYLKLYLDCDSLNRVYIKHINEQTKQIQYKYILKDNVLSIKAYTDTIKQLQVKLQNCKNKIIERKIYIENQKNNFYLYIVIGVLIAIVLFLLGKR